MQLALTGLMRHRREGLLEVARRAAVLARRVPNPRAQDVCFGAVFAMAAEVASSQQLDRLVEVYQGVAGATKFRKALDARAEALGEAKGKAATLLQVMRARYGLLPQALADRVASERRHAVLDRWGRLAGESATLEQFERAMDGD